MHRKKRIIRKPDPLMLMALLVSLSMLMTTTVDAGESFFSDPNLSDLVNGDLKLTEVGHRGAGIHMFFQTPVNELDDVAPDPREFAQNEPVADFFLSVRIPW